MTTNIKVVSRADDEARNGPLYSFSLLLLALLPYVYVVIVFALIVTLVVLPVWTIIRGEGLEGPILRLEIAVAVIGALLLRSIWIRVPPLKGVTIPEQSTAALLKLSDEIADAIRAPRVQAIVWTEEVELSITPVPRLSLLGCLPRYYLTIGLPLVLALSPEQFRARLAQELGRFARTRGRLRSWLYGERLIWTSVLSALSARGRWGSWFFGRFLVLHGRFFTSYARPALRYHEYEADRCAADLTSAEVTAEMLVRLEHAAYVDDEDWDDDDEAEEAERDRYTYLAEVLATEWTDDQEKVFAEVVLAENTTNFSLQPVLKDRLAALEQPVRLPALINQSAAAVYLSGHVPQITEALARAQREEIGPTWQLTQSESTAGYATYDLGTRLLLEDQAEGVPLLESAMELDPNLTSAACGQISAYYNSKEDFITASRYSRRSQNFWELYNKAVAERTQASFIEKFVPHNLSALELEQLRTELAQQDGIKAAYLVRKEVIYLPEKPLHTLSLVLDRGWFSKTAEDISFAKRLDLARKGPPELYTVVLDYKNRRLGNIIRNIPNSLIYQRSG